MEAGVVIVVGSLNVDMVVRAPSLPSAGQTVLGGSFERHGGGKGANKAVAASRAGARTWFVGAVGEDQEGIDALAELAGGGVDVSRCLRLRGVPTGIALIVVDARGENQIAVAPGANAELDAEAVRAGLEGLPGGTSTVVLADFEIGADAVLAAGRWARERGCGLVVNPAPARSIDEGLFALAPVLTPNAREAAALTGVDDPESAGRELARRAGAPVIVTLGEQGALRVFDGDVHLVQGVRVDTVDTTGAGDAFNGILSAELSRGAGIRDALRWAVAGAALSTMVAGARAGSPTRADIERLLGAGQRPSGP